MKKVLILTKTNWAEPPRIRHQITRLLKDKGYEIIYVEKNEFKKLFIENRREEGIEFYGHAELIHHQLRYFPIIQYANNFVVKFYLRKILKKIEFDFVLNFCYDYSFLRELIPAKKIITVIEDDFESQAKFGMTRAIRNQVNKTCRVSDCVLTVSYPLRDKLLKTNSNVKLFFPWSQQVYMEPRKTHERNAVLYFGFVHRLHWNIVESLIKTTTYVFRFIGPTAKARDVSMINHLRNTYSNFEYIPFSTMKDLKLDDVFCSILPYDPAIKSVQACTISNRAFNLLSLGLPLAYADLQYLIDAPASVITKNRTIEDYKKALNFFKENFYDLQGDIKAFLLNNYADDRWKILEGAIKE